MAKKNQTSAPQKERNFGYYFKRAFLDSCVYYTIMILIFMIADVALNDVSEGIKSPEFLGLYPFAFLIGCANLIFSNKSLKFWSRITLHAVFVIGGFIIYLTTISGGQMSTITFMSVAFIVVYVLIMTAIVVILSLKAKKKRENVEYQKMYDNITETKTEKK